MGRRLPNPYRIKIHRNYTIEEARDLLGVHKNTIRNWIRNGLPTCDCRPTIIVGEHLFLFVHHLTTKNKRKCRPGEMYCMHCRSPRTTQRDEVALFTLSSTTGNLAGNCSTCGTRMNRRVRLREVAGAIGHLALIEVDGVRRLIEPI